MKKCKHIAVAEMSGKDVICPVSMVERYCLSMARIYWVGDGKPPAEEIAKYIKLFKKNPYCPKCGDKYSLI